jgi:hypothetical protein
MTAPTEESNPFGEMGRDPRDHMRPAKTAGQAASSLVGFGVMGLGGLLVLIGVLDKVGGGALWLPILALGIGVCHLGYWLYYRGQTRSRRGPQPRGRRR